KTQIEDEIMSAVEEGAEQGVMDQQEKEMIESVIQFRDTTAGQIMTSRPEIVALDIQSTLDDVKRTVGESGHTRVPVYEEWLDHIVGILYARDLLHHLGLPAEKFEIRSAMRPAVFVPTTKPLRDLLQDFRAQKVHIAIVLDEYGGTAGLVTIEDILEELVGEIADEHDEPATQTIHRLNEDTAEIDARMRVEDVNEALSLSLPEDESYDTIAGYVFSKLGK